MPYKMVVHGLSPSATTKDVREAMSEFGRVARVEMRSGSDGDFANVLFASHVRATKMQNQTVKLRDGSKGRIERAPGSGTELNDDERSAIQKAFAKYGPFATRVVFSGCDCGGPKKWGPNRATKVLKTVLINAKLIPEKGPHFFTADVIDDDRAFVTVDADIPEDRLKNAVLKTDYGRILGATIEKLNQNDLVNLRCFELRAFNASEIGDATIRALADEKMNASRGSGGGYYGMSMDGEYGWVPPSASYNYEYEYRREDRRGDSPDQSRPRKEMANNTTNDEPLLSMPPVQGQVQQVQQGGVSTTMGTEGAGQPMLQSAPVHAAASSPVPTTNNGGAPPPSETMVCVPYALCPPHLVREPRCHLVSYFPTTNEFKPYTPGSGSW